MVPWHAAAAATWPRVTVLCAALLGAHGFLAAHIKASSRELAPHQSAWRSVSPLCTVPGKDGAEFFIAGVGFVLNTLPEAVQAGLAAIGGANSTTRAVDKLHSSTLVLNEALKGEKLVQRDCFADFKRLVDGATADDQNPSLLVYGPRGAGKTSIVAAALQNTAGVLYMSYQGDGLDLAVRLEHAMMKLAKLPIVAPKADPGDRLRAIFTIYKQARKRRPIVIIDINEKMEPATLSKLLMAAKQLGFEEKLATFIFVVSASRSALGLTVTTEESRVDGYSAPDFTEDEALAYLAKHLSPFPAMAEFVVQQVGTRAMHLVSLCRKCQGAKSETECRGRVEAYRTARIDDAGLVLLGFVAIAEENAAFSKEASLAFFKKLLDGTPVLKDRDAMVAFGFKKPDLLLAALAQWHAFAVDPFEHTISMQSHFMQIAIEQYLQAEASSVAGTSQPSSA